MLIFEEAIELILTTSPPYLSPAALGPRAVSPISLFSSVTLRVIRSFLLFGRVSRQYLSVYNLLRCVFASNLCTVFFFFLHQTFVITVFLHLPRFPPFHVESS